MFHCHTTESDGGRSVADAVGWYADHGYDVLAITDHNRVTSARPAAGSPLLVLARASRSTRAAPGSASPITSSGSGWTA